jgi:Zinc-ribbon containing domain
MGSEEVTALTAHAGEKAQKTGDFYCAQCDQKVHVKQGDKIPRCPNGHTGFESRRHETDTKS